MTYPSKMDFEQWRTTVYMPTREKFSKILASEIPTDNVKLQEEFHSFPPMSFEASELRRDATQYYREAKLVAELALKAEKYPSSSLYSLAKSRCGLEEAIMHEAEDIQEIIRERRWDVKKILFGFTERDT